MNHRKLAIQALNYLSSISKPLPCESDTQFYEQNRADYAALLKLNKKGLGATEAELLALSNAPLSEKEVKAVVSKLIKLDALISAEYAKQERIEKTPNYWDGFYSGYEATPTNRCKQLLSNSNKRINNYSKQHSELAQSITINLAAEQGYCVDGMDDKDFKSNEEI